MTPDEWFRLWLALLQTVGGGLVTLCGVLLGFRFARVNQRRDAMQEDVAFWIRFLTDWSRRFHDVSPMARLDDEPEREAVWELTKLFYDDVTATVTARPSPRNTVDDFVQLTLLSAPLAINEPWPPAEQLLLESATGPGRRTIVLHHVVIQNVLSTLVVWRTNGFSRRDVANALGARMEQRGLSRVPEFQQGRRNRWQSKLAALRFSGECSPD
ncbi:hypothetical protein [Mycobacteroides abscessus]|uniref:hypothetical protein n=1 Tax=Mycobacteroides abscessus TaxID=36809 RepID=UPI0018966EE4